MAQTAKNPPVLQETWVRSLGWEDPLKEGMATHFQYSCLENPHGQRGAWQAIVHGVAKSRTQLSDYAQNTHTVSEGSVNHRVTHSDFDLGLGRSLPMERGGETTAVD